MKDLVLLFLLFLLLGCGRPDRSHERYAPPPTRIRVNDLIDIQEVKVDDFVVCYVVTNGYGPSGISCLKTNR